MPAGGRGADVAGRWRGSGGGIIPGMDRSVAIPYVALDPDAANPGAATFVFVRLLDETFVNPPSDPPHRHAFHELILVETGRLRHTVDGEPADLGDHALALIARGQVHTVDRAVGVVGWMLRVAEELLPAETAAAFPVAAGGRPTLALAPPDLAALAPVADLLEQEAARPLGAERDAALRALVTLLLLRVGRIARAAGADPAVREGQRIYRDFVALLERDFAAHHGVAHYAAALGLDPDRLSAVLTGILGVPAKRTIDERLALEAKRLLRHTPLALKEIAAALGYADPFHLSKAFKRVVGLSPQEYRLGKPT